MATYARSDIMETLGSLIDKLCVVNLKRYHVHDEWQGATLKIQNRQLKEEIDEYVYRAVTGDIPKEKLISPATKIYKKEGNAIPALSGDLGFLISELATINCQVWHEVEQTFDFESVPAEEKDKVVKQLNRLNLQRSQCIDLIDVQFQRLVAEKGCKVKK